jgi:alpha-1,3-rhamnosyltransferase
MRQTVRPKELLVIDDGSKDGSPEIIRSVLTECDFPCELIVNENRGLCASLNEGLAKTSGTYFAYLGSDDMWLPEFLEAREKMLESRTDAVLAYGHAHLIDVDDNVIESTQDWKNFRFPDGDPRPMLYSGTAPISSSVVYRRRAVEKFGWNADAKLEDYELYLLLAEEGAFAFDQRALAAWRIHDRNTSKDLDFMLTECLNAQERVAKTLGWEPAKLDEVQTRTRFFFGEEFERKGHRSRAAKLILENMKGAPSSTILCRALMRLILPHSLTSAARNARRRRSVSTRGKLEML